MNHDLFLHTLQSLGRHGGILSLLLAWAAWGGLLVFALLRRRVSGRIADEELAILALGGWSLPALLLSLVVLTLRLFLPAAFVTVLSLALMLASGGWAVRSLWRQVQLAAAWPALAFLIVLLLRIGFAADLVLPPYFDSAEHYRIIQALLQPASGWPASSYYHLGYHVILAGFTALTGADLAQTMMIFGQIVVAALPLPMYLFVKRATGLESAAWFAVLLAGFGWFVPAHAANWGKYPALLGMLVFQFMLGLIVVGEWKGALLVVPLTVFVHTRMVVLMALALAVWVVARRPRWGIGVGLGVLAVLIWRYQDFGPLWDAYGTSNLGTILNVYAGLPLGPLWGAYGNLPTLLSGLLAVRAARRLPRLVLGSALALLLGLLLTLIPPAFPLLDRPLTEMVLSLPLAFAGGLGAAHLPRKWILGLLMAAVAVHAWTMYSFAPSPCCQLAGTDDMAAMEWLKQNTLADARILIASADYSLGQATLRGAGTDAGLWVTPLTGRVAVPFPHFSDFRQASIHDQLCYGKISYLYVGGKDMSFNADVILASPDWYRVVLSLANARIVQVLGCGG
ncbi:MAG: hypothetical protein HYZ25_08300 [Chloroflexi bacterium]|nr:hypothetical protein [Chloroflexota bacterium]